MWRFLQRSHTSGLFDRSSWSTTSEKPSGGVYHLPLYRFHVLQPTTGQRQLGMMRAEVSKGQHQASLMGVDQQHQQLRCTCSLRFSALYTRQQRTLALTY